MPITREQGRYALRESHSLRLIPSNRARMIVV